MRDELARRAANAREMLALLRVAPLKWHHWQRFAKIAPCAWRTRLSDARKVIENDGGQLVWNRNVRRSAYRWVPYAPLGRDAGEYVTQKSLPL